MTTEENPHSWTTGDQLVMAIRLSAKNGDLTALIDKLQTLLEDRDPNLTVKDVLNATPRDGVPTPLGVSVEENRVELTRWLLDKGADPDFTPPGKTPALMGAVTRSNVPMVELLLSRNATPWIRRRDTNVSLTQRIISGIGTPEEKRDMVAILIRHGRDPGKSYEIGQTDYEVAQAFGEVGLLDVMHHEIAKRQEENLRKLSPGSSAACDTGPSPL